MFYERKILTFRFDQGSNNTVDFKIMQCGPIIYLTRPIQVTSWQPLIVRTWTTHHISLHTKSTEINCRLTHHQLIGSHHPACSDMKIIRCITERWV